METNELWLYVYKSYKIYTEDLAVNNLQGLICHTIQTNSMIKESHSLYVYILFLEMVVSWSFFFRIVPSNEIYF